MTQVFVFKAEKYDEFTNRFLSASKPSKFTTVPCELRLRECLRLRFADNLWYARGYTCYDFHALHCKINNKRN